MSSIFSRLQNQLNLLGGGQTPLPQGFVGPQQPPVQGPPTITQQIGQNYQKIAQQPGFNNALFRLGTTLLAAREQGMGLGQGLVAGQEAYNTEMDRAQTAQSNELKNLLTTAQISQAMTPERTALEKQLVAAGLQPGTPAFQNAIIQATLKPDTVVNLANKGESTFVEEVNKKFGQDFVAKRDAATQAIDSLRSTQEAKKLLNKGVITGFGADYRVGLGKAAKLAGFNQFDDDIANSEAFVASRAQEVGRVIQLFGAGTGLSDSDRQFATKAAAGDINLNEASIKRILDINERASRNVIKSYNKDLSSIKPSVRDNLPFNVELPTNAELPNTQSNYNFSSVRDAESANLPKGTEIIINGRRAIVE